MLIIESNSKFCFPGGNCADFQNLTLAKLLDTKLPNLKTQNGNILWACYKQVDDNQMRKLPVIKVS